MREAFQKQLEYGQAGEYRVRESLCAAGAFVSKFHNTNRNDFQLVFNNQTHRVEIKTDRAAATYKNLFIEMMQGREQKDSGIAVSEASVCIHYIPEWDDVAMYRRVQMLQTIKMFVRSQKFKLKNGGDNFNMGVCFPLSEFCELGKVRSWIDYRPLTTIGESHLWGF